MSGISSFDNASLSIFCAHAVQEIVKQGVAEEAKAGRTVAVRFGTMGQLKALIAGGERADMAILSEPIFAPFEKSGVLIGRNDLACTEIGLVVREGQSAPDISTADQFKQALLRARVIARTDPKNGGTAGVFLADLLVRFGIAQEIDGKSRLQADGNAVAQCVADGEADIGITLVSEIVPVKGAAVGALLPSEFQCVTRYVAGVFADSRRRDEAHAFISYLTSTALVPRWKANGFTLGSDN